MTIDEQAVRTQVRELVGEMAPVPGVAVTSETVLTVDLGYESLLLVELISALESHFGLEAYDEESVADVDTVGDVENNVLGLLREQAGAEASP